MRSWKAEHAAAMQCRDFEKLLAETAKVFELMDELVRSWRECVFRGQEASYPEFDAAEKQLYGDWLRFVERAIPQLESLERTFGVVEGADEFRSCVEKARSFLANWTPARVSTAVGLRSQDLTEEDADEIRGLLNQAAGAPGRPTRMPRSLPTGDPSLLR